VQEWTESELVREFAVGAGMHLVIFGMVKELIVGMTISAAVFIKASLAILNGGAYFIFVGECVSLGKRVPSTLRVIMELETRVLWAICGP